MPPLSAQGTLAMKLTMVAFAACAALILVAGSPSFAAGDRPADFVINNLYWSTYAAENNSASLMLADGNCCNCAPTDSDQQCFQECNAIFPRCRPAAPRPALPSSNVTNPNGPITGFCCYGNVRKFMSPMLPLGAQCRMSVYNWGVRENYWVTGRACY